MASITLSLPDDLERNRFSAAVREGIEQADRGELIDDDEIRLWLEQRERS